MRLCLVKSLIDFVSYSNGLLCPIDGRFFFILVKPELLRSLKQSCLIKVSGSNLFSSICLPLHINPLLLHRREIASFWNFPNWVTITHNKNSAAVFISFLRGFDVSGKHKSVSKLSIVSSPPACVSVMAGSRRLTLNNKCSRCHLYSTNTYINTIMQHLSPFKRKLHIETWWRLCINRRKSLCC